VWRLLGSGGALYADISTAHCKFRCFERLQRPPLTPVQLAQGERPSLPRYSAFFVASLFSGAAGGSCSGARAWELELLAGTGRGAGAPVLQYPVGADGRTANQADGDLLRVIVAHRRLRGAALLRAARRGGWGVSWMGDCGAGAGISASGFTGWQAAADSAAEVRAKAAAGQPLISARVDMGGAKLPASGQLSVVASLVAPPRCLGAALGLALSGSGAASAFLSLEGTGKRRALRVVLRAPARYEDQSLLAQSGRTTVAAAVATIAAREVERCGLQMAWISLPTAAAPRSAGGAQGGMLHFAGTAPAASGWTTAHSAREANAPLGGAVMQLRVPLPPRAALSALQPVFVAALVHEGGGAATPGAWAAGAANGGGSGAVLCGTGGSGFSVLLGVAGHGSRAAQMGAGWRVHYIAVARRLCAVSTWGRWGACRHACGSAGERGAPEVRAAAAALRSVGNATKPVGGGQYACFQLRKRGLRPGAQGATSCEVPALRQARACTRVASLAPTWAPTHAPIPARAMHAPAETTMLKRLRQRLQADLAAKARAKEQQSQSQSQSQRQQQGEEAPAAAARLQRRGVLLTVLASVGSVYLVLGVRWCVRRVHGRSGGFDRVAYSPRAAGEEQSWGLALDPEAERRRALKRGGGAGRSYQQRQSGVRFEDDGTLELHPMGKYDAAPSSFSC
jgi:hypothetical protein